MVLMTHIVIALTSVVYATYLFFKPSVNKLRISYFLVALTFASGSYLIWNNPSHIVQACVTGIIYLGIVLGTIVAARHKLAIDPKKTEGNLPEPI